MKKDRRTTEQHSWRSMIARCYNSKRANFYRYGGTGIKVCDRWRYGENGISGFKCFLKDMGYKPSPKHSLDRINMYGNYEPANCKWSTPLEQVLNRRRLYPKTEYLGVVYDIERLKFKASHTLNKKSVFLGRFSTAKEAAQAYNAAAVARGKTTGLNWITPTVQELPR